MLSKLSWPVLTIMAGSGGMGIGVMLLLLNRQRETFANQANFIKRAVAKVREDPAISNLLGGTMEVGTASFQDGWSKIEPLQVRIRVPLKGSEDNGALFVYARKKDEQSKLRLFKIEMAVNKVPGKKLILMNLGDGVLEEDEPEGEDESSQQVKQILTKEERKEKMDNLVKSMITRTPARPTEPPTMT